MNNQVRTIGALAGLAMAASCLAAQAAVPMTTARDGHLVVPTYINRSGPYPFILDTGADESAVYAWFATQLKLEPGKSEELSGQTGSTTVPTYHLNSISIDGRSLMDTAAYGFPNRHDAGEEAGVAGNDLMDGAVAVFDFPCKTVALHPKPLSLAALLPAGSVQIEAGTIADGTLLTLPVEVGGVSGTAFLDTGSRDSRISPAYAAAAQIDSSAANFRDAEPVYGANSKAASSRIGPVGSIRFAGITVPNATARVIDLPVFQSAGVGDHVMLLGTDLMGGYRLVYDHEAKRLWFGKSSCKR